MQELRKESKMRFFDVYKLEIKGEMQETLVMSDGTEDGTPSKDDRQVEWLIGYKVYEYEEDGTTIGEKTYYIDRGRPGATPDDLLAQIEEDHQPDMWQCHNW